MRYGTSWPEYRNVPVLPSRSRTAVRNICTTILLSGRQQSDTENDHLARRAHHVHVPGRADRHVRLEGMQEEEAQEGREERERRMRKAKAPVQHVRTWL